MKLSIGKKLYAAFGAVVLIMLVMVTVSLRAGSAAGRGMASVSGMMINSETAAETFQSTLQMRAALGDYMSTHDPEDFRAFETHQKAAAAKLQECRETFANDRRIGLSVEGLAAVERFARAGAEIRKALTEYDRVVAEELDVIAERMSDRVQSYQTQQAAQNDLEKLAPAIELADQTAAVRILALRYQRSHEKADFDAVLSAVAVAGDTTRAIRATETAAGEQAALDAVTADLNAYASAFRRAGALIEQSAALLSTDVNAAGEQLTAARVGITESLLTDGQEVREQVTAGLAASRTQTIVAATIAIVVAIALALLVSRGITRPIRVFLERFELIAGGDFTQRVECRTHDEIRDLAEGFNKLVAEVAALIGGVQNNAEQVSAAATEVAATSEQMASSTEHQRAQLTQVAAAIEEMAATVTEVSGRTGEVSRQSTEAGEQASEGGGIVRRTVEEMGQIANQVESTSAAVGQLSEKAVQIGEILTVINDIADQTNLLALNAAIEAARAGEHGRGFAVVADEVRKLAERTQEATQEVSKSIGEIQTSTKDATDMMGASKDRVSSGVELAQQAGLSLESIVKGSTTVAQSIDSIAAAVEQQSATSAEIARSIEVISAAADESTQGANQAAAAATQLSGNAESLRELVARFKV